MMNQTQIDKAILAAVELLFWRKVAMVMCIVADVKGLGLPEGEARYEMIGKRIEALVREGRLEAQGNLKRPRHSEVRLPERERG